MRERKEIEEVATHANDVLLDDQSMPIISRLMLEVLLDIRDLLQIGLEVGVGELRELETNSKYGRKNLSQEQPNQD